MKIGNVEGDNPTEVAKAWITQFGTIDEDGIYTPPDTETVRQAAIDLVKIEAKERYDLWYSEFNGFGDWLAVIQAVEDSLRFVAKTAIADIKSASTSEEIGTILAALTWPPLPSQAEIEADVGGSLDAKADAKQFLEDYPNARLLIELEYEDLITAIQNRTANQETLLLMTLAFGVRYLKQLIR